MGNLSELIVIYTLSFITLYTQHSLAYTIYEARQLYSDKTANYTKHFRPLYNQLEAINISIAFELIGLKDFDEINEKISVIAVMQMGWTDESMAWTPASYGGLESMTVNNKPFWTPLLTMTNTVDKLKTVGGDDYAITFEYDGSASWYPGDLMSAMCSVDVTYYPFDTQRCIFEFIAWAETTSRTVLHPYSTKISLTYFTGSGAWDITDSSNYITHDGIGITMKLVLKRKPLYIIANVLLPIVLMSIINILVFLIPAESGERVSFSVTVLLALAVFLTIVGDNLPKISTPMALLAYYLTGIVCMSVGIVLLTIVNLRFYHTDPQIPVTPFWIRFVRLMRYTSLSRCQKKNKTPSVQVAPASTSNNESHQRKRSMNGQMLNGGSFYNVKDVERNAEFATEKKNLKLLMDRQDDQTCISGRQSTDRDLLDSHNADSDITWQAVSVACDKVFLVLFALCLFLLTLISFVKLNYNV